MPITSVNIDAELLEAAKATYRVRTNREAINLALEDAVRRQRQLDAVDVLASIPVELAPQRIEYEGPDVRASQ